MPEYNSDGYLIVTKYVDNCDYPYFETDVARFYKLRDNDYMWLDSCGEYVNVVAWRELPVEFDYDSYFFFKNKEKK